MGKNDTAILVVSFDGYSDLWDPYFKSVEKFWSDCPYDTYLLSNNLDYNSPMLKSCIAIGDDISWSSNLLKALDKINKYKYVLLMMEDGFLRKSVNTPLLMEIINEFKKIDGNFLTLLNDPKPTENYNKYFGELKSGQPYRVTATYSIWNLKFLFNFLNKDESAWQFEKLGSRRSDQFKNGFFATYENHFDVIHAVIKGKWQPESFKEAVELGFLKETERLFMSKWYTTYFKIYSILRKFIFKVTPENFKKYLVRN